ncbi:hypothetical protein GCM10010452_62820 [Crossiella cryophila]
MERIEPFEWLIEGSGAHYLAYAFQLSFASRFPLSTGGPGFASCSERRGCLPPWGCSPTWPSVGPRSIPAAAAVGGFARGVGEVADGFSAHWPLTPLGASLGFRSRCVRCWLIWSTPFALVARDEVLTWPFPLLSRTQPALAL